MAFNQPDILPSAAEAIYRVLDGVPGKRLQVESLVQRIVPDGNASGLKVIRDTLRELRSVSVVEEADGKIALSVAADGVSAATPMRAIVARCVMDQARAAADIWGYADDEAAGPPLAGASDLVRALAWLLLQRNDGSAWAFDGPTSLMDQHDRLPFTIVRNEERWTPFVRWATYMGLASTYGGYRLVPDPTRAVEPVLRELLHRKGHQPLDGIVAEIGVRIPVLDGGQAQRGLLERYEPDWDAGVSPALTLALLRLRRRGVLEFDEGLGDATKLRLSNDKGALHALRWKDGA